ncbi:V-type ATP synthase subunit I domain-containing protein [Vagococcus acidifermentans]|uniref:Uncharacterized protein n=1 Tax=Vagococcus acidifermentans TaxID=564710 RepID=A0A430B0M9_9ENTE|nr:hypothetical protein [Vagococcus acidifermentans]RSU13856.1 hypothetical protein CBF27_02850 [Vagococcus acidifermentans]
MSFKKKLLGIILSFSIIGTVASSADHNAYQKVFDDYGKNEIKIEKALNSEFISANDTIRLEESLAKTREVKDTETRRELKAVLSKEKQILKEVEQAIMLNEITAADKEFFDLNERITTLETKSKENFILKLDEEQIPQLKDDVSKLKGSTKVKPIRLLSEKVNAFSRQLADNQEKLTSYSLELQELNKKSGTLAKKEYITDNERTSLQKDSQENELFFKDADNLDDIEKRIADSKKLVEEIESKQKETEADFKEYKTKSEELIKSIEVLLSAGDLTAEEESSLKSGVQSIKNKLNRDDYQPGDLKAVYMDAQSDYSDYLKKSDARIAEAKKKAEEKAAAEAARQAEIKASANNSPGEATYSAGWYRAPAGYKYLKVESGKTYGQVKNPGNFRLITDAEAANYSPGHGNGSAKQ